MYIIVAIVMLLRGFADAIRCVASRPLPRRAKRASCHLTLRSDLHRARRDYDLLRGDAFVIGLMNLVVPLQIGARDVASRSSTT